MAYIDRDGVRIYYESLGAGPVVLLSHGFGATADMWTGQADALADRARVVTWDMRGHGRSDSPADPAAYSEALTVGDMAAILDALDADSAVIGGLSLGGYMALAFHLAAPERTRALMLFDTGPGYRSDDARERWNEFARERAGTFERDGLEALTGGDEVSALAHRSADGLAHAARGMLAQVDARIIDSLPGIDVPTLVLAGERDEPFLAATDYMASKIPGATKVVIEDAGHAANLQQPAAFNAAVLAFLEDLEARRRA